MYKGQQDEIDSDTAFAIIGILGIPIIGIILTTIMVSWLYDNARKERDSNLSICIASGYRSVVESTDGKFYCINGPMVVRADSLK
jgi:hypothetical protein